MATIIELEDDNGTITLWVEDITGLKDGLQVTVEAEFDPGQIYKAPNRHDEIGQEGLDAGLDIDDCYIEYGIINGVECRSKDMELDPAQLQEIEDAFFEYNRP